MKKYKIISLAVDRETDNELEFISKDRKVTKASLYREAVREYLDRERNKHMEGFIERIEKLEEKYGKEEATLDL